MNTLHHQTGETTRISWKDGAFRCFVNGKNYIGETLENLVRTITALHPTVTPEPPQPEDKRTETQKLRDILIESPYMVEKQTALSRLLSYARLGEDLIALEIAAKFKKKPAQSREARNLCFQLGKTDLIEISPDELTEFCHNVVLRGRLTQELTERLEF